MTRIAYVAVALTLSLAACRGGDNTGDDVTGDATPSGDGSGSNAGVVTVKQVQNDTMPSGTQIELKGVVVLAIDTYGAKTGDLWVGDPEGGAFSGVKVFGAPLTAVATLAPGDLVNIENAQKYEFACSGTICGGGVFDPGMSITEVEGITAGSLVVNKVGTGTLPAPAEVDALAISLMADQAAKDAEWEKWEGVRIKVINARQTGDVGTFGAAADDQKKFDITGGAVVESVLSGFPAAAVQDTCFAGITGIGDYFFDYLVLPTATTDVLDGGAGCAALPVATDATIAEVQAGTKTGLVNLADVYVSAIAQNRKNYWVASSLTAAANEGVYVFRCSSTASCASAPELPATVTVGSKISLKATTAEFNNDMTGTTLTQLTFATITAMALSAALPTAVENKTVAELVVEATGEPYESVLVTLTNVKVTSAPTTNPNTFGVATLTQNGTAFKADDDIYLIAGGDTSCYASITGIWTYNFYNNVYQFLPIAVGTGTGTCI